MNKFLILKKWLLGLSAGVLATSVVAADTFVFTAIPDQDEARLMERFGKVATYLSKELGVETRYVPVKSYAAAVTAFRNDQVQLAWFGGLSGVRARLLVEGSEAIAQGVEDPNFETYFIDIVTPFLDALILMNRSTWSATTGSMVVIPKSERLIVAIAFRSTGPEPIASRLESTSST